MTVAIIGAGIAGLTAAYTLHQANYTPVTTFEKSRGLTGRAATRWYDRPAGRVYVDHGAQYVKTASDPLSQLMLSTLDRTELTDINRPVWVFDAHNHIIEGDPLQNAGAKWSYTKGLATLGRLMVQAGGLTVKTEVRVGAVHLENNAYRLADTEGRDLGTYSAVIVAIPAGQAADLIAASTLPSAEQTRIESALRAVVYRRCLTVVLGYDRPLAARPYYALVNTDRGNPISWAAAEHEKPGHVPTGCAAWVVQMAGAYSKDRWEADKETVIREVGALAEGLLGPEVAAPDWTDLQKWRYSLPDVLAAPAALNGVLPGLYFAGDYLRGGRVHLAAESGQEAARAILG
jgi:predicted NAD/FAD-dependent oxidoreductase